jgi:hypothetical protein
MSSPVAATVETAAAKVAHAPESKAKAKKPRQSRGKKEETDKPEKKKAEPAPKEAKEEESQEDKDTKAKGGAKRKAPGEKHPPFEEIIRECISEATGDVRDGVSRPAIKSAFFAPTSTCPCCHSAGPFADAFGYPGQNSLSLAMVSR